jgi:putative ABC transport system ATP-binding protein
MLLADEPTGNLDSRTSAEIMAILKQLHERDGKTILMVTHDAALADRYAQRTLSMLDGAIVSDTARAGATA